MRCSAAKSRIAGAPPAGPGWTGAQSNPGPVRDRPRPPEVETPRPGREHRSRIESPIRIEGLAQPRLGVEIDRRERQPHEVTLFQTDAVLPRQRSPRSP